MAGADRTDAFVRQLAPQWAVALRLNNALDRDYADRADFAFGNYRYFPGRGRALFAEVAWARP